MPKQIKKKVQKSSIIQEDVNTVLEKIIETAEKRQKQLIIAAIVLVIAVASIIGIAVHKGNVRDEVSNLENEGYKQFTGLYQTVPVPEKERREKALENFTKAYKKGESPYPLYYMANCQYALGKYEEAIASMRELNQKFPDNEIFVPLSYYKMALSYMKMGNSEEALKSLSVLANYRTDSFKDLALIESARILEQTDRPEEAVKIYAMVANNFPESVFLEEAKLKAGIVNDTETSEEQLPE